VVARGGSPHFTGIYAGLISWRLPEGDAATCSSPPELKWSSTSGPQKTLGIEVLTSILLRANEVIG
jgi:hypothetical protein